MRHIRLTLALIVCLLASVIGAARADYALLTKTGDPVSGSTHPYLTLTGLTGQSACAISVGTGLTGTLVVEGHYTGGSWTGALAVQPTTGSPTANITSAGSYAFNCATMDAVRADATLAGGNAQVTLNAGGGTSTVIQFGGGGGSSGISAVSGTAPIVATTSGGTSTISCPTCSTGGGGASAPYLIFSSNNAAGFQFTNAASSDTFSYNSSNTQTLFGTAYPGVPITSFTISCIPYNAALVTAQANNYPYQNAAPPTYAINSADSSIGGGVVTVYLVSATGITSLGNLTIANQTAGGGYTSTATLNLGSSVTLTAAQNISAVYTSSSGNPGTSQDAYSGCHVAAH